MNGKRMTAANLIMRGSAVFLAMIFCLVQANSGLAQKPKAKAKTNAAAAAPAKPQAKFWATQCTAVSRSAPADCVMEQRVVLRNTGQQLAKVALRVPAGGKPALLVQLPLGLSMRDGLSMTIDNGKPVKLDIQTCEASGCYAGSPVSNGLLTGFKRGNKLALSFLNNQRKAINLEMPLTGFGSAFDTIK